MTEFKGPLIHHQAWWTFDPEANAYYFAPATRTIPPYLKQITVEAILDVASDGTLAGIELLDAPPPPSIAAPIPAPTEDRVRIANRVCQQMLPGGWCRYPDCLIATKSGCIIAKTVDATLDAASPIHPSEGER